MLDRLLPVGRVLLLLATTGIVLALGSAPFTHAAGGPCVSAKVAAPVRLPDGAVHPAGTLTVCRTRTFSPVSDLHLISVDHRPMGMFLSQSRRAEGVGAKAPEIVFRRDVRGELELLGYTMPTRGRSLVHRLALPAVGVADNVEGAWLGIPVVAALAR